MKEIHNHKASKCADLRQCRNIVHIKSCHCTARTKSFLNLYGEVTLISDGLHNEILFFLSFGILTSHD